MKSSVTIFLAMLLSFSSLKAQDYNMIANVTDCSFSFGDVPPSATCNKFLNVENGMLRYSEVPEGSESAQWEFIKEWSGSGEDASAIINIKNRLTGKFLNAADKEIECTGTDTKDPASRWYYYETDVATLHWVFVNEQNNRNLIIDNENPLLAQADQLGIALYTNSNQWSIIQYSGNSKTVSDLSPEYQDILDRHNYWRSQLGVAPLVWSDEVAAYAKDWADQLAQSGCKFEHRKNGKYGENLYMAMGGNPTGSDVADSWASERKDFNYDTWSDNWMEVGHYTQMIWENSTKVGCAMVKCSNGDIIWVCNYDPPGNMTGENPYRK